MSPSIRFAAGRCGLFVAGVLAALLLPATARAQLTNVPLVSIGDPLTYFKGTEDPPADWTDPAFDEASDERWIEGQNPIGYGEGPPTITLLTTLTDMQNTYLTVYLRYHFTVENVDLVSRLRFNARYDDGFVAYINGTEVLRRNVPAGVLTRNTAGVDHEVTSTAGVLLLTGTRLEGLLSEGDNVLAIEVHNVNLTSSDLIMEALLSVDVSPPPQPTFIRGAGCDGVTALDLGDPIYVLRWRFGEFYTEPGCVKACDMNDDGAVDLSDAVFALNYLFQGGDPFPAPYPDEGEDPTEDSLTCVSGAP